MKKQDLKLSIGFANHGKLINSIIGLLVYAVSFVAYADQPDVFLLNTYQGKQDLAGWVMSEKLDGIRGFWDGQQLLTRSGKPIYAPSWFTKDYPPFAIDGELWTKRGDFENISSIVRTKTPDDRWQEVQHYIFEVPEQAGGLLARLSVLQKFITNQPNTPIRVVQQIPILDNQHAEDFLQEISDLGGEGVVVRNPNTAYETGRLKSALKLKQYTDAECVVKEILPGKGKYSGKMGSLLCETQDKKRIRIGSGFKDSHRNHPPEIGTIITFKYYGLTKNGKPKYASFLRFKE